jgi:hypothetical protein
MKHSQREAHRHLTAIEKEKRKGIKRIRLWGMKKKCVRYKVFIKNSLYSLYTTTP